MSDTRLDWRQENAAWLRLALRQLRLRLYRLALSQEAPPDVPRLATWLVAGEDVELRSPGPDAGIVRLGAALAEQEKRVRETGRRPSLSSLAEIAGLSALESDLLLFAAAPALDGAFGRAYAELQGDTRRDHATLHLGLSLLVADASERLLAADCLAGVRPLRSLRLLDVTGGDDEPLLTRRLSVDERVTDYMRGVNRIDARIAPLLALAPEALPSKSAIDAGAESAKLIAEAEHWVTVNLIGVAEGGARDAAWHACDTLGLRPHVLDLAGFAARPAEDRSKLTALLGREALLAGLAVVVDGTHASRGGEAARAIDELIGSLAATLFVISAERWPNGRGVAAVHATRPSRAEQRTLWRAALDPHANSVNGEVDAIVQQFDMGPGGIADVVARVARRAPDGITGRELWRACREQTGAALDELARRVTPCYGWDDIVVSDDVRAQLRELAAQVQQRGRVYETWGLGRQLGRGRGITALFAGPSGTGKTMAAEILAAHLELDLYRIDLAGVVSKYIGETEKNLRRVFEAAERSGAILFFDEADALFGSRTEVRDSHDRYANLEINYLLQRMEDYSGLAILATNRRAALDAAFLRRLRFAIDFSFPGADDRQRIWERVFPAEAATRGLEYAFLSRLDLSGGNIRSVAVNAAFLAAAEESPIGMEQVVRAAAREYVKLSKPISAAEFGAYYPAVRR